LRIPTLSGSGQTFVVRSGFTDGINVEGTDGCYFKYTDTVNSGKWQGFCVSNGTSSTCDVGTSVAAATWYRLTVVVTGTATADFQIAGTTGCTVSTNIPSATGRETGINTGIVKTGGTTERTLLTDYIEVTSQLGR